MATSVTEPRSPQATQQRVQRRRVLADSGCSIALPLLGAAVLLLGGRRTDRWGHLLGCATAGRVVRHRRRACSSRCSAATPTDRVDRPAPVHLDPGRRRSTSTSACCSTSCRSCFVLLITGVGSLIHIYSVGYMEHDPDRRRFFGYLNLFVAAMLLLVLADNYLAAVRRLGGRRSRVVPADRLLELQARATPRPRRRRSSSTGSATSAVGRDHDHVRDVRHASASPASSPRRPTAQRAAR